MNNMKNLTETKKRPFKGAGMLIGFTIGSSAALVLYLLTREITTSIPIFAGVCVPIGMAIEKKLQGEEKQESKPKTKNLMIFIITLGLILLSGLYFYAKF
ncbi:MAG: hypothetical protein C0596_08970 [Marinilabiliales bacterium]|mgnify:CR=1 FL=1|nr:MAG: hypothetical protein C0596_08970 [Marinilabiliales bacterium]